MKALSIMAAAILLFAACKKEEDKNPTQPSTGGDNDSIQFVFDNKVNSMPVTIDNNALDYTNYKGNDYSISLLKYYVSRVKLHVKGSSTYETFDIFKLIDEAKPAERTFTTLSAGGEYDSIIFYLGVPPDRNHSGAQDGDLDPGKGMIWSWNTGYIFFKHEGKFVDSSGNQQPLRQHYGTDDALVSIALPVSGLSMDGNKRKVTIGFDLHKVYGMNVDFNEDFDRQSISVADQPWIAKLKANFPSAFTVKKVE